jgi:hypothetical protein
MSASTSQGWQLLQVVLESRCPERAADIRRLIEDLAARGGNKAALEHAARVAMAAGIQQVTL